MLRLGTYSRQDADLGVRNGLAGFLYLLAMHGVFTQAPTIVVAL